MKVPLWCLTCLAAVISGYIEDILSVQSIIVIVVYSGLLFGSLTLRLVWLRRVSVCLFGVVSLALATHLLPGFYNDTVVLKQTISVDAIPFSLYANFDKGLVGLFVLVHFFRGQASADYFQVLQKPLTVLLIFFLTPCLVLGLAMLLGLIQIDVKVPVFWLCFLSINFFFTCVAEEAFFRGFLQQELSKILHGKSYLFIVPIISALLFGIAHIGGGLEYAFIASAAGLGYGIIFHITKRIEWPILCHFVLNSLHFFLFTYPMLG
jgi:membrane protease YdiL (CAAX protease family)